MFSLTTVFFLVEIIVGYVTNSMALVADSFHMLSDIVALIIAFLSIKVSCSIHTILYWGANALCLAHSAPKK